MGEAEAETEEMARLLFTVNGGCSECSPSLFRLPAEADTGINGIMLFGIPVIVFLRLSAELRFPLLPDLVVVVAPLFLVRRMEESKLLGDPGLTIW